ncbi:FhaA domain-containing protein [Gryllotalpicola ginsengisoli]|uniref:FhaA domain-containing protein n=1 Tax=Gryllotalpicola ginsengisoli TaxID=444608 RepID=UPI0003B689DF|nr:DUF3662 and FHA domain-containing protein [Gryllotalpicola ginsengisoli]
MGFLDNFEKGLERAVNMAFAKTFRSGLQPVELTSALRREMDTKAAVVARDRILTPNSFTLRLAPADYERMSRMGGALTDELTSFVQKHARAQHYAFAGAVSVELQSDTGLSTGVLEVDSGNVKQDVRWSPVVDVNGKRHPLTHARTVIGRGSEADITVDDTGISRRHVEIAWDGNRAQARDLGSTNGSKLNDRPLSTAVLSPGDVITAGRTRIVFDVVPQAAGRRAPGTPAPGRRRDAAPQPGGFWSEP